MFDLIGSVTRVALTTIRMHLHMSTAQSDRSLRYALKGQLRTQGFFMRTAKTLSDWIPANWHSYNTLINREAMYWKRNNRKVQGVPRSETAANPWHQEQEKKDKTPRMQNKQTNAPKAYRPAPSSPSEVITMLKELKKHEDKEQGKTRHEAPRSISHSE